MNRRVMIILAFLGGIDTAFYIFTPIILAAVWVTMAGLATWTSYFIYGVGLFSTLFRAIKIGWLKNGFR